METVVYEVPQYLIGLKRNMWDENNTNTDFDERVGENWKRAPSTAIAGFWS
jgi:hypothetical protein